MIYILHHSKGTLMLSAPGRDQVVKWSERQLGEQARLVSISEKDFSETGEFVEKDGTGIATAEAEGCQPLISVMANIVFEGPDVTDRHPESDSCLVGPGMKSRKSTVH